MIFERLGTRILAISVDSVHAAKAFAEQIGITSFPPLGDLKKEVCRSYGVLREEGFSERATFLVDKEGIVRYRALGDLDEERSITDYIAAVDAL